MTLVNFDFKRTLFWIISLSRLYGKFTNMCGLCGYIDFEREIHRNLDNVVSKLGYRGPDDSQIVSGTNFSFGHTRLAIQDEINGIQPMLSKSKELLIIFNGEIYNHMDLRTKLPDFEWKTSSDTETLLELLEAFGDSCISELIGMFAFAVWNFKKQELILARDGCGEKPLYYSRKDKNITFCSESISVPTIQNQKLEIEMEQLKYFLKFGYLDPSKSLFKNVKVVEPGTVFNLTKSGAANVKKYEKMQLGNQSIEFSSGNLRSLIEKAVERTLIADNHVGIMLSGGVDSSIIAAIAQTHSKEIPLFTFSFQDNSDDVKFASKLAKELKMGHHIIEVTQDEIVSGIVEVISALPNPFGDTAIIPTFMLAKHARQYVKVLLSGDGADEIFGGYGYYEKYRQMGIEKVSKFESYLSDLQYVMLRNTRSKNINKFRNISEKNRLLSKRITVQNAWNSDLQIFTDKEIARMFRIAYEHINKGEIKADFDIECFWRVLEADRKYYLSGDILQKADLGGMLASVEIRSPYLDKPLRQYLANSISAPSVLNKSTLYEACSDLIPKTVYERKKQGFGVPLDLWFSISDLKELIADTINNKHAKIYQYLDFTVSQRVAEKSKLRTWNLFVLAHWLEINA